MTHNHRSTKNLMCRFLRMIYINFIQIKCLYGFCFTASTARRYYDIHVGRVANIKRGYKTDIYENKKYDILLILLLRRRNCSKMKLNKILILKALRLKIKQKNKTYCAVGKT